MQVGNLQNSYNAVQKSLEAFPGHTDSKELMKQLEQHFAALWETSNLEHLIFGGNPITHCICI